MPTAKASDGSELYFYDWGQGKPIVLIHGWPLTCASWEYQARFLADNGFRVIAYDRRGFGRSEWSYAGYDYDTLSADLASVIDHLDLHDAALVGFSMGGGEVARYVARHNRGRVTKAIFVSAVTPYLLKTADNPEGVDRSVFDEMVQNLMKDRPAFLHQFSQKFYGRSALHHTVSEPFLQFTQSMALTASPKATIDLVRAFSETDFREDLAKFTIPTLVIHGTADSTVPIEASSQRTAKLISGAQRIEYEGEPHGLTATAPDRLNRDLVSFLQS